MKKISGGYADRALLASAVGVVPIVAVSNQYLTGINSDGVATQAQPQAANLSDYEIFDWIPTDQSGAGLSITVNYAKGFRLGKKIILFFSITYPATSDTNAATISIPYTAALSGNEGAFGGNVNSSTSATAQSVTIPSGGNTARFRTGSFGFATNANLSGIGIRGQINFLLS